jgi:hypothetical protein
LLLFSFSCKNKPFFIMKFANHKVKQSININLSWESTNLTVIGHFIQLMIQRLLSGSPLLLATMVIML